MSASGLSDSRWSPPGPAMLFCPADRPDRYAKAADRADVVILDLEDAVAPDRRDDARAALVANPATITLPRNVRLCMFSILTHRRPKQ